MSNQVMPGIYQHYKGNLYLVTAASVTNGADPNNANDFIEYYPLTGHESRKCVRWEYDFIAPVIWSDGKQYPRFRRIILEMNKITGSAEITWRQD